MNIKQSKVHKLKHRLKLFWPIKNKVHKLKLVYVELSYGGTKTAHQLSKITSGVLRRIHKKKPKTRKNLKQETPKKISLEKLPRILIETKKL